MRFCKKKTPNNVVEISAFPEPPIKIKVTKDEIPIIKLLQGNSNEDSMDGSNLITIPADRWGNVDDFVKSQLDKIGYKI